MRVYRDGSIERPFYSVGRSLYRYVPKSGILYKANRNLYTLRKGEISC